MARVVGETMRWREYFEAEDVPDVLIDQLASVFRQLGEVASEGLRDDLRKFLASRA
jgi:hypothetical protein